MEIVAFLQRFADAIKFLNDHGLIFLVSVIVLFIQTKAFVDDYFSRKRRNSVETAIGIAEIYANEVLPLQMLIIPGLSVPSILDVVTCVEDSVTTFDYDESEELYPGKITEFNNALVRLDTEKLIECNMMCHRHIVDNYNSHEEFFKRSTIEGAIREDFIQQIVKMLNKLEHLAMRINEGIAHESTIYPSLHPTFLRICKLLYFFISHMNRDEANKYYTHIIQLYNRWNSLYSSHKQELLENQALLQIEIDELKKARRTPSKKKNSPNI